MREGGQGVGVLGEGVKRGGRYGRERGRGGVGKGIGAKVGREKGGLTFLVFCSMKCPEEPSLPANPPRQSPADS